MLQFISLAHNIRMMTIPISIHLMLQFILSISFHYNCSCRFQYISCCSLSNQFYNRSCKLQISIHLMLQFIHIYLSLEMYLQDFNTSHVVVYRSTWRVQVSGKRISIHLMLQFIAQFCIASADKMVFQYISCCSLSKVWFGLDLSQTEFQYISCCSLS